MAASKTLMRWMLVLGSLGCLGAVFVLGPRLLPRIEAPPPPPPTSSSLGSAPREVQEFLARALEKVPADGKGVSGYRFFHWPQRGKETEEAIGLKAVPHVNPTQFLAAVMDVDAYTGNLSHVTMSRSKKRPDQTPASRTQVAYTLRISVPAVNTVQQELMLVDAGEVKGYRIVYWYLRKNETEALDPKDAARSAFNVGAWLVAPGVVGYALSSWPRKDDLNAYQQFMLTRVADSLAKKVVEDNIDGMAAWSKKRTKAHPPRIGEPSHDLGSQSDGSQPGEKRIGSKPKTTPP